MLEQPLLTLKCMYVCMYGLRVFLDSYPAKKVSEILHRLPDISKIEARIWIPFNPPERQLTSADEVVENHSQYQQDVRKVHHSTADHRSVE